MCLCQRLIIAFYYQCSTHQVLFSTKTVSKWVWLQFNMNKNHCIAAKCFCEGERERGQKMTVLCGTAQPTNQVLLCMLSSQSQWQLRLKTDKLSEGSSMSKGLLENSIAIFVSSPPTKCKGQAWRIALHIQCFMRRYAVHFLNYVYYFWYGQGVLGCW